MYKVWLIVTTSAPEYGAVTGGRLIVVDMPPAVIVRGLGLKLVVRAKAKEVRPEDIGMFQKLMTDVVTVIRISLGVP